MNNQKFLETYKKVLFQNYVPLPIIPDYGRGSELFDVESNRYIDFTGGIAVNVGGHQHQILVESLKSQAEKLWHMSNFFGTVPAIELAEYLTEHTFADRVFFSNSGTEANEAAIKLARRYSINKFGPDKHEIISFENSFHGRSMMMVTIGGQEKYKQGFGPLASGIFHAQFNDINSVKKLINKNTATVIIEPIQGEGGIQPADHLFLKELRELCDRFDALLIFDEIQTGVGRTGHLYAYEHYNVIPDILTTAKALGGGFPIGATLAKEEIAMAFTPGTHGSTFGGNPLATKIGLQVLKLINHPELFQHVKETSEVIKNEISRLNEQYQLFKDIRGIGLLIGLELVDQYQSRANNFMQAALQENLLVLLAGPDTVRLAPALNIDKETLADGLALFEKTIKRFIKE